jgi:hypothetical protein
MQIARSGCDRNRGEYAISLDPRYVMWSASSQTISLSAYRVRDFDTPARHNWTISVTPEELAQIINAIGGTKGGRRTRAAMRALEPALTAMLKLATKISLTVSKKHRSRVA